MKEFEISELILQAKFQRKGYRKVKEQKKRHFQCPKCAVIAQRLDTHLIRKHRYKRNSKKFRKALQSAKECKVAQKDGNMLNNIVQSFYEHIANIAGGKTTENNGKE